MVELKGLIDRLVTGELNDYIRSLNLYLRAGEGEVFGFKNEKSARITVSVMIKKQGTMTICIKICTVQGSDDGTFLCFKFCPAFYPFPKSRALWKEPPPLDLSPPESTAMTEETDDPAAGASGVSGMAASELNVDMHAAFVKRQSEDKDTIEYVLTEHLRMSGVYWGLTGMHLMGRLDDMDGEAIVEWVMKCRHECGGFGGSEGHDPHVLYTLSAVQVRRRTPVRGRG